MLSKINYGIPKTSITVKYKSGAKVKMEYSVYCKSLRKQLRDHFRSSYSGCHRGIHILNK